jgi:hypothetical protein
MKCPQCNNNRWNGYIESVILNKYLKTEFKDIVEDILNTDAWDPFYVSDENMNYCMNYCFDHRNYVAKIFVCRKCKCVIS